MCAYCTHYTITYGHNTNSKPHSVTWHVTLCMMRSFTHLTPTIHTMQKLARHSLRTHLVLGALFMITAGCNIQDNDVSQAECASNQECESTQLCTIQGKCVDLSSSMDMDEPKVIADMSSSTEDMQPDLVQSAPDLGLDMPVADQAPDMPTIDMPDMTLDEGMPAARLPPSQTSYSASGSFTFRAAAPGESGEISIVGELANTLSVPARQGVFMHQKMGGSSSGFQLQGDRDIALLDVAQGGDRIMAVGTIARPESGIPNGMWASFSTRIGGLEYGRHYTRDKDEVYTHVVTTSESQWVIGGVTGPNRERFFVAHIEGDGAVMRAEAFSPPIMGALTSPLRVMALQTTESHAYVMTQRGDSSQRSTLITRLKLPSLDHVWSVEVEDVRLYDMVVSGDAIYAVGHIHGTDTGVSALFELDGGTLITSAHYQDIQLRALTEEDDSTLWALGQSTSSADTVAAYRIDPMNPTSAGVELSPATLDDTHAASLLVTQGYMTAFASHKTGGNVTLYPMNATPITTCAMAPFGSPTSITASPQSITVNQVNPNQDSFDLEHDIIEGVNLVGFSPTATSPLCK